MKNYRAWYVIDGVVVAEWKMTAAESQDLQDHMGVGTQGNAGGSVIQDRIETMGLVWDNSKFFEEENEE